MDSATAHYRPYEEASNAPAQPNTSFLTNPPFSNLNNNVSAVGAALDTHSSDRVIAQDPLDLHRRDPLDLHHQDPLDLSLKSTYASVSSTINR
jgi:hypothetical protein